MILAQRDVQLAIGAERESPAFVAAIGAGRQIVNDGGQAGAGPAAVYPADDPLPGGVVGAAIEGKDEMVFAERRTEREAE